MVRARIPRTDCDYSESAAAAWRQFVCSVTGAAIDYRGSAATGPAADSTMPRIACHTAGWLSKSK
jgi:hypothetical protein